MSGKEGRSGVYVNISPEYDQKLAIVARLMPLKPSGKKWFKREIIGLACEKFIDKFLSLLDGATTLDEMLAKAKGINPDEIEIDIPISVGAESETTSDLPDENPGLKEF